MTPIRDDGRNGSLAAGANHALLTARVCIPEGVTYKTFARETVVLSLDTGLYHGLNATGGKMLDTLATVGSVQDAADVLAREYRVPLDEIRSDLCGFCETLATHGLLTIEPDTREP
jgi:hypothetical protein